MVGTIALSDAPRGIAVTGNRLYATNFSTDKVTVIDTATLGVVGELTAGVDPYGVVAAGGRLYVSNITDGTVSVIDTTTNTKITDITVGAGAAFLGAHGNRVYVSNAFDDSVSVIDTTANTVVETVPVGSIPQRLAVSPDGHHVYVINGVDGTISVITSVAAAPVNHPPVAYAGTLQNVTENGVATGSLANLVTDADGDALTLEVVTQPALGTVTFLTATTFRYVAPAEIGTATSTTFTYRAFDGAAYSDPAIVTINFVNSNDAPVAADDSYAAEKDATLTIAAPGVLANDSDVDSTALTVVPMTGAAHGTLNLHPDGSFTYTPATGFVGTDSFTYAVSDGTLQSNIATATITVSAVNHAPVATNTTLTMDEYASIAINLANSSSDPDGDALTGILIDGASHGVLNFFPNRTFNYNPDTGFVGTDSFTYTVSDGALQSNIATVTIIVTAHNDAPTATDDTASVDEDTTVTISVLSNDSDPDGDALSVISVGTPGHGSASLGAGGVIAYTPAENYFGDDSFTYTVGDGALTATATVAVTVNPVEDAPVIQSVVSRAVDSYTWIVTVTAYDPDGTVPEVTLTADDPSRVTITPVTAGLRSFARALIAVESAPSTVDFEVVITDTEWALAHPGQLIGVTAGAGDGTSAPVTSEATVGAVINVVGVGSNVRGQLDLPAPPPGVNYVKIATDAHTVALRSDGSVIAIGGPNENGELDIPDLPDGLSYSDVAVGAGGHTVLLRSDGTVVAVGRSSDGQTTIPELPDGLIYTHVAAGDFYTILVRSDNQVTVLGDSSIVSDFHAPALPEGVTYTGIAAGHYNAILLRSDGQVDEMSSYTYDIYGAGIPPLPEGLSYVAAAAGEAHAVLLRSDGQAIGVGYDYFGQATPPPLPPLPPDVTYTAVAAGGYSSVLLRSDGTAVAFGLNSSGVNDIPQLPGGATYVDVFSGGATTFLLTAAE